MQGILCKYFGRLVQTSAISTDSHLLYSPLTPTIDPEYWFAKRAIWIRCRRPPLSDLLVFHKEIMFAVSTEICVNFLFISFEGLLEGIIMATPLQLYQQLWKWACEKRLRRGISIPWISPNLKNECQTLFLACTSAFHVVHPIVPYLQLWMQSRSFYDLPQYAHFLPKYLPI